jgi:hypothetical protein
MNNYYVYVYIDPRNYEEFYYGKGKGSCMGRARSQLCSETDHATRYAPDMDNQGCIRSTDRRSESDRWTSNVGSQDVDRDECHDNL